jgi:hypothetical protein
MRNDSVLFSEYDEGDRRALLKSFPDPMNKRRARGVEQNPSEREISCSEES